VNIRRRDVFALLAGGAAATSIDARAQAPTMPVIGFLSSASPGAFERFLAAFRQGLSQGGYVEDKNVAIEYRWAEGQYDRLSDMAADLVRRRVALITASGGIVSARAAKAATDSIPIIFLSGLDPVQIGWVASLARPGGNLTGVSLYTTELVAKRMQLLRELVPKAETVAFLLNPESVVVGEIEKRDAEAATRAAGVRLLILTATVPSDLDKAFALAVEQQAGALLVTADPFFTSQRTRLVALAARHSIPAAYPWREYAEAGGLMSYGPSIADAYQQVGRYASRILKGMHPSDLPVQLPTKFDLVLNMKTARALGITIPYALLASATAVVE
jgi:ABC-type uncharacterized transport system substrate-binding protein